MKGWHESSKRTTNAAALTLRAFHDLFANEDTAQAWFERVRWSDGPACPACGLRGSRLLAHVRR
ncbi:transposase [Azospirillum sp. A1-3]|uniref:transposase n=1 Tax=Azospirillum sp. A1-3 TaxID=185874 RepID=UPI00336BB064